MSNEKLEETYFDMTPINKAIYHAEQRKAANLAALEKRTLFSDLTRVIRNRKEEVMAEVRTSTDPAFSDKRTQEAETNKRLRKDEISIAAREELKAFGSSVAKLEIEARYHADMIRILCAFGAAEAEVS